LPAIWQGAFILHPWPQAIGLSVFNVLDDDAQWKVTLMME
jgi:hypothetical protein